LVLLVSCGTTVGSGGTVSPAPSTRSVAFTDVGATGQAHHDSGATIVVGMSDASRAIITRLLANVTIPADRVLIAAFQGQQRTGGYGIRVTAIERKGDQLVVTATFTQPKPDDIVTQAFTSPAHVVSIAAADAAGLRAAILIDSTGAQRALINTT
jgi:protease stability complex PrcB-like protein